MSRLFVLRGKIRLVKLGAQVVFRNYRVIHLIVNQEQGCCELVFCTSEVPKGFYVTPRSGANCF